MPSNQTSRDYSVLYVEDEDIVRETLAEILARKIKTIYTAENGESGLNKYIKYRPDIVITDIRMPILDGIEMSKRIKEIDSEVQILVTTAHNEVETLLEAIDIGITQYLIKPIRSRQLFKALDKVFEILDLKHAIERNNQFIQNILNLQDNIIIVTDGNKITTFNKALLKFFDVSSIEEFEKRYNSIQECFEDDNGFLKNSKDNWIDTIIKNDVKEPKVKISRADGSQRILLIKHVLNPDNESEYIVSFTDITDIENQRLAFKALAYKDPLTQISNRLKLDAILERELEIAKSEKLPLSLIMFDIDHFKNINDTYGHDVGDSVLIELTDLISDKLRKNSDMFARWGGEEFMIVLPNANSKASFDIAERLREIIESHKFKEVGNITCSFGVSEFKLESDNFRTFTKRVDEALYKSKNSGRNRVERL